ncbi:MAG: serine hydrolase family protein, partial [Epsilonproteobacteria bacterium]|nr:serine hydrolase family protein [Campylobacterota bacterium]
MKKDRVLLLHGWGGSSHPHWQSYLASEIAKEYGCVSFLEFSEYDFPKMDVWRDELLQELKSFKPTIVICHSLANTLWFHLCNENVLDAVVQKLFLVAPPSLDTDIEELKEFFPLQLPKNLYAEQTLLITSTNDPYLTQEEAKQMQQNLNVEMEVLQDAGHINADSGFGEWEWM